jgi:hypothetical protein
VAISGLLTLRSPRGVELASKYRRQVNINNENDDGRYAGGEYGRHEVMQDVVSESTKPI